MEKIPTRRKVLPQTFFDRPTLEVAQELLGKFIVRRHRGKDIAVMITEVEAYDGPHDRASHASRGITPRTEIMFGEAGHFYIYFTYGMHWLLNIVTGAKNYPAAVLFRAGEYKDPKTGEILILKGPALLTKFMKIDGSKNCRRASKATGLWFEDRGTRVRKFDIIAAKRIGVDYAGKFWARKRYNFKLKRDQRSI